MSSTDRFFTDTVDIKRAGVLVLQDLESTVLFPAEAAEIQIRFSQKSPYKMLYCFIRATHGIREGDYLIFDSTEYPIRYVEDWTWSPSDIFQKVFVEELK